MHRLRLLLLSSTRSSRVWRIAERISSEMPNTEVCGVIQHSFRQLPLIQQMIATGDIDRVGFGDRKPSKANRWLRKVMGGLIDWVLWCAHGCPRGVPTKGTFTVNDLAEQCRQRGW